MAMKMTGSPAICVAGKFNIYLICHGKLVKNSRSHIAERVGNVLADGQD